MAEEKACEHCNCHGATRYDFATGARWMHESNADCLRALHARLSACERVVKAARVLFGRNEVAEYEGRIDGVLHASLDDFNAVRAALAALDGVAP